MTTHHIYLIPGFFGFVNFGRLVYFTHVREYLDLFLHHRGIRAEIHRVRVSPSASLKIRAIELARVIADTAAGRGPIHLIGHSTGGLDARLVVSPGTDLGLPFPLERYAKRVKTVVSVLTPHLGTPLATRFGGQLGRKALELFSLTTVAILRTGGLPLSLMARLGGQIARIGFPGGKTEAILDHLYRELMGFLPGDDAEQLTGFFTDVVGDHALLPQLTAEGIDIFNASTANRDKVRYGCVVSRVPPPRLGAHLRLRRRIYSHASYELFRWLHGQVGGFDDRYVTPLAAVQRDDLRAAYGNVPNARDNDGIVPTLSQIRGEIIHAATADHLDVIGHFDAEEHDPPHHDWITSGATFTRHSFERLWSDVGRFLIGA